MVAIIEVVYRRKCAEESSSVSHVCDVESKVQSQLRLCLEVEAEGARTSKLRHFSGSTLKHNPCSAHSHFPVQLDTDKQMITGPLALLKTGFLPSFSGVSMLTHVFRLAYHYRATGKPAINPRMLGYHQQSRFSVEQLKKM